MIQAPTFAMQLFTKNIDDNLYMNTIRAKEVTLTRENEDSPVHIDGTPIKMAKELNIKIVEGGLKVLVKKRF